jgi:RNA polymerase sigma factor (sigma-70 family)
MLVERHHGALLHTAGKVVGTQRAEDVVQEALLRAFRALAAGTRVEHFQAWLHQIVRNTAVNQLAGDPAQAGPLPVDLADRAPVGPSFDDRLVARDVLAQIAALPERQRTALVETELQGRSRRDIAADLDLTEGAVRQLVHRARRAVRVAMTAFTPYPLAAWVAHRGAGAGSVEGLARIAPPPGSGRTGVFEGLTAGSAAGGGALLKGGATVIAVSALGGGLAWRTLTDGHWRHQMAHNRTLATARRAPPAARARATPATITREPAVVVAAVTWHPAPTPKARSGDAGDRKSRRTRTDGNDTGEARTSSIVVSTVGSTDGGDGAGDGSGTSAPSAAQATRSKRGGTSSGDSSDSSGSLSAGSPEQRSTGGSDTSTNSNTLSGTSDGSLTDSSGGSSPNTSGQAPAATPGD